MAQDERFLTTGQVAEAVGVSAVTVKAWIKQGKLTASRTPGGHFRIAVEDFRRFREAYPLPSSADEPYRVLVVDDDAQINELIVRALETLPLSLRIESASNGYDGLVKVGTLRPHLLVLDLRMPQVDGFEVCSRLKGDPRTRATKILAVTAYVERGEKERVMACGADAFMAKPFLIEDLLSEVSRLLTTDARRSGT